MKNGRGKGPMSLRQIDKILKDNGYYVDRYNGSHCIYKNDENHTIIIPLSCHKQLIRRVFKENNIIV